MERVVLLSANGEQRVPLGSYLVVSRTVESDRLHAAITKSIAVGTLDPRFAQWDESAIVSVAVRLDAEDPTPVMYVYLPMDTGSPLPAHLNAPFVPKVARTTLDESVRSTVSCSTSQPRRACAPRCVCAMIPGDWRTLTPLKRDQLLRQAPDPAAIRLYMQ